MLLSVPERIIIIGLLPEKGDYSTFRIVADLRMILSFSEEELKEFGIKNADGKAVWEKSEERELEMSPMQMSLVCEALSAVEKAKEINGTNIGVYEKFMLNGKSDAGTDSRHPATASGA